MVREVVMMLVGQCGIHVGYKFWEAIFNEHEINVSGAPCGMDNAYSERMGVYFNEATEGRYIPRSILVDLDPGIMDSVRSRPYGHLFSPDKIVSSYGGAGNNWARGHCGHGEEVNDVLNITRKEIEKCDQLQGFQLCHSLGGGTGSGMGARILSEVIDECPDRVFNTFSLSPSPKVSNNVVEAYNAILSLHHLAEMAHGTFLFDNQAVFDICSGTLKLRAPTFQDVNDVIAAAMAGITATIRYPGKLNGDLQRMVVNLVLLPRLQFFMTSYAPLIARESLRYLSLTVSELARQIFDHRNVTLSCDRNSSRYWTASASFKGTISLRQVDEQIFKAMKKRSKNFMKNLKIAVCNTGVNGPQSATLTGTNKAVEAIFKRTSAQFKALFRRKAFLHWYTNEGVDEMEFTEAETTLNDIIAQYEECQE